MCYGSGCVYEQGYTGDCLKPSGLPCPEDEEAVAAYEAGIELQIDWMLERGFLEKERRQ